MVKKFISYILLLIPFSLQAQENDWVAQPISGSITVYFPSQPGHQDTIGQSMYYLLEGKDMMLATVSPIPNHILTDKDYHQDSVLNNYINSVVQNANRLIYSDVNYKEISAIFYKVRVEDPLNEIRGLITDSYNFIYLDTIYSISYLRYKATDLYDYTKQRTFFDRVDIHYKSPEFYTDTNSIQTTEQQNVQASTSNQSTFKFIGIAILILLITLGIYMYQAKKGKK